jgi:hypothetical protein
MGRPRKKASELTTEEAIRRLFGKNGARALKELAREADAKKPRKPKKQQEK